MGTAPAGALFRPRAPRPRPVRSWGQSSQPPPTAVQPEPAAAGRHRAGSTVPAVWGHPAMAARLARAEPGTDERSSMRTRLTIMAIVLAAAAGAIGIIVLLVILLGWLGLAIGAPGIMTVLEGHRRWIQPWQHRWGATDEDGHRAMPGDDLIPELQQLQVDDPILMLPDMGPRVRELEPNRYFVAGDQEAGVWCLALYPTAHGCRLVSRWRVSWPLTLATAFWILLSDPGAFIMEHKMLKGIRSRAEAMVQDRRRRLLQHERS